MTELTCKKRRPDSLEKTGRICYGMELDEHYCSVIIRRWEQFTGQKVAKIE